ncbi:MAG: pseudaminic acid cytidylyltransferase [bacterium]|nr:pseudaminic acid cytidylyltransferase [bacterium]
MKLALIPARGGSKRISGKNIKSFCGQPIIAYSIEAALASDCFDRVIVSTDREEIAEVAREHGAEIPFMRPARFSDDHATTMDVIRHALSFYEDAGETIEAICCLYATAPFVTANDLHAGWELMAQSDASFVFSATSFPFPIQRAFYLDENERVNMFQPENLETRSQDLREAYYDAGQFYWCRAQAARDNLPIFAPHSKPLLMARERVQDIDTLEDWNFAEKLFKLQA